MIAVITADIINSTTVETMVWLNPLKEELNKIGSNPKDWEIYRGDSFQLVIDDPALALISAIKIKAVIKSIGKIDIRIAIGLGERSYEAEKVTESNGTAFINSGSKFEVLKKEKQNLAIKTNSAKFDLEMNLYLKLGLIAMDNWTENSAEIVKLTLDNPSQSQDEIGKQIGIKQATVSHRLKRAYFSEMLELNEIYKIKLQNDL